MAKTSTSGITLLGSALLLHGFALLGSSPPAFDAVAVPLPRHAVSRYVRQGDFVRPLRLLAFAELSAAENDQPARLRVVALGGESPLRNWAVDLSGTGLEDLQGQMQRLFGVDLNTWFDVGATDGVRRWANPEAGFEYVRSGDAKVGTMMLSGLGKRLQAERSVDDTVERLRELGREVVEVPAVR